MNDLMINHPNTYVTEMLKVCSLTDEEPGEKRKRGEEEDDPMGSQEPPQKKKA